MKKIYTIIAFVIFILSIAVFSSCEDKMPINEKDSFPISEENNKMLNDLKEYNLTLVQRNTRATIQDAIRTSPIIESRRVKLWHIMVADALGGLIGGILSGGSGAAIGAVFTSGAVGFNPRTRVGTHRFVSMQDCAIAVKEVKEKKETLFISDYSFSAIPSQYLKPALECAATHNAALEKIRTGEVLETKILTEKETSLVTDSIFVCKCNEIVNLVENNETSIQLPNERIEYLVFNLFSEALTHVEKADDIEEIINAYAIILENNAELTEINKSYIYESLAVAAYSYDYWLSILE